MPSYPGKPMSPAESLMTAPLRLRTGPAGDISGSRYFAPNSAR